MVSSLSPVLNSYYSNLYSAGSAASALLSAARSNSGDPVVDVDSSVIAAYYQAKAGVITPPAAVASAPVYATAAPTTSALTSAVLGGGAFVDPSSIKLTSTASTPSQARDYRNLFALYQGLTALQGLASKAATSAAATQPDLASTFARGLSEVQAFLDTQPYQNLTVADGTVSAVAQSSVSIPQPSNIYTTGTIYSGTLNDVPAAFSGDVQFSATVASLKGTNKTVSFNLADLGSTPRTIGAVAAYFNTQLQAAGVATRFASVRTPGTPNTVQAGGETITLGQNPDSYALKVTTGAGETVAFAAPTTQPAVYLAQTLGVTAASLAASPSTPAAANEVTTADATQQVLKFDVASSAGGATASTKATLAASVSNVAAQVVASDGSRYVLANLSGASPDGQPIKGVVDAALLKYDSAGTLLYARTLGSTDAASGSALALSADGTQVAIVGSVVGALTGATSSTPIAPQRSASPPPSQSFVTVYDTVAGLERWTQTTGAAGESTATAVAFAPDGTLYVTGDTTAAPGQTDPNLQRGYLQSFKATVVTASDGSTSERVAASDVVSTGSAPGDPSAGVVVTIDGGVVSATVQHGDLVLQRYDGPLAAGTQPTATRDLGDLNGGSVAGVALTSAGSVVVAGSTSNDALAPGAATNGGGGGQQAFVATLAADLAPGAVDRVTYLQTGAGDATATALTVSGNQVYVAGAVEGGVTATSRGAKATTGFAAAVDASTGAASWSTTLTGTDDQAAPSAIAVSATGSSVLDQLGLPQGALGFAPNSNLVANTSLRAGDQFSVRSGSGAAQAVTISVNDTLSTLASKINSALGYAGSATIVPTLSGDRSELKIVANTTNALELGSGLDGADALGALGLTAGLVTSTAKGSGSASRPAPLALNLSASLDISTTAGAIAAQTVLTAALATIQSAYTHLGALKTSNVAAAANGPVPSYITAQIADYQLALSRLTGG